MDQSTSLPSPELTNTAAEVRRTKTKNPSSDAPSQFAVHMTLQHKGGVTKSFVAGCMAQFYQATGRAFTGLDADPSNKSFFGYQTLGVRAVDIMTENRVDPLKFDAVIYAILGEDRDFVIDNGATNFLPFTNYLVENQIPTLLAENGRRLVVHVPIVGGAGLTDTLSGLNSIATAFSENTAFVVWLNEAVSGPILANGKTFQEMAVYERHKSKILAMVKVARHSSELFNWDMQSILTKRMTFSEAIASSDVGLISKQRLKTIQREIFEQLALFV